MAFSPDQESLRVADRNRPEPFASLASPTARRRFWLFELLMAPFQDHDERASYRESQKATQAQDANGVRVSKAWNGNGAPVPSPAPMAWRGAQSGPQRPNGGASNGNGIDGYAVTGAVTRHAGGGLFNSVERRPAE